LFLTWNAENETEVSFFNRELYDQFKQHPEVRESFSFHKYIVNAMLSDALGSLIHPHFADKL
jgi:hypothetical protein